MLQPRIDFLKSLNLQLIALSPRDSSEEAVTAVREAHAGVAKDVRVEQPIAFGQ